MDVTYRQNKMVKSYILFQRRCQSMLCVRVFFLTETQFLSHVVSSSDLFPTLYINVLVLHNCYKRLE